MNVSVISKIINRTKKFWD